MSISEKDFQFYLDHQSDFVKKYNGKILVISEQKLVGVYDTIQKAYDAGMSKLGMGNFIVQKCSPGKADYSQSFYSRVRFA